MKKTISILIISFSIFFFSLFFLSSFTKAEEEKPTQSALGVSQAMLELVLDAGQGRETTVSVFNVTNFPLPIKGMVKSFARAKGEMINLGVDQQIFDASSWFQLEPADFILQPYERKEIKVMVLPPINAEPGGHYATVYFQPLLPEEVVSPQSAFLTARVGILAFLIVKGDIKEEASLGEIKTRTFHQFGPIEFKIPFQNEGNVHLTPSGEILINDFRHQEVEKLSFSPQIVLPQSSREMEANWDKKFLLGKFTAQINVSYGSEEDTLVRTMVFWVVPWLLILITIFLLTLFVLFFILIRKRFILALKILFGKNYSKEKGGEKNKNQES